MNCTWDGRCMTCGTKITTCGCPNVSCPESTFGVKIIVPTVVLPCGCGCRCKPQPATVNPFVPIMPDGFTTTTRLMG